MDADRFNLAFEKERKRGAVFKIISVGALRQQKITVINAIAAMGKIKHENIELHIYGAGFLKIHFAAAGWSSRGAKYFKGRGEN